MKKALALSLEFVRHEPRPLARFIPASVGRATLDRVVTGRPWEAQSGEPAHFPMRHTGVS